MLAALFFAQSLREITASDHGSTTGAPIIFATWVDLLPPLQLLLTGYILGCVISGLVETLRPKPAASCGRRVCAWCKKDLGEAVGLTAGKVTHTVCPTCKAAALADTNLTGDSRGVEVEKATSAGASRATKRKGGSPVTILP